MIEVIKVTEHSDGSATMVVDYDQELIDCYKNYTRTKTEPNKEKLGKFIVAMLENYISSEDNE